MVVTMSQVTEKEQVRRESIRELIEKLKNYIVDLDQVRAICQDQYGIGMIDSIDFENDDFDNYNGQKTFKLDFEVRFVLPMLIDRQGNCISVLPAGSESPTTPEERFVEAGSQAASTYTDS